MGGFIEPSPATEQRETNWTAIGIGVALVLAALVVITLITRSGDKGGANPHPYASNVKLSDLKMSAAENFAGSTVTYLDGNMTNQGDKTVIRALARVIFRNSLGEVAQQEDVPLRVLSTGGPYLDAVDLSTSPLGPGQSKPFRLTFEHVTADWNQAYPDMQVVDVSVK
jgi:hypothetical protein